MNDSIQFFERLAAGVGFSAPRSTVEAAMRQAEPVLGADASGQDVDQRLGRVCAALGLTLTRVDSRIDEAAALAVPRRPVLMVLRRDDEEELVAIYDDGGPTVRVEILSGSGLRSISSPRIRLAEALDLGDARLAAAMRVSVMGGGETHAQGSFEGRPLLRLWSFLAPDQSQVATVVGFSVALGVLALATPIAVQTIVNFIAFGGVTQPLVVVGVLLLFFLAFAGTIRVLRFFVVEIMQRRVFVRAVSELSSTLPRVRLDAYDGRNGPELVNRFFDVLTIQKSGSSLLINGLDVVLQAGIGLVVLGFYHPFLLVFDAMLIGSIAFIVLVLGRGAVATARKESSVKYAVAAALEELATSPLTHKLSGSPEFARARLAELAGGYVAARRSHFGILLRQTIGAVALHAFASTSLLTLGGYLVMKGELTLGQLVAAELIVSVALISFVKFSKQLESYYDLIAGVEKLGTLLDLPVERDLGESHLPGPDGASLELRRVCYRFRGGSAAARDFSLSVAPGQRLAVCGPRRAGKSTLAEIVAGMRDADSGVVLFDGADLRELAKVSLRTQLQLVKGLEVVHGSILENLRLGRSDLTMSRIRAGLAEFGILDELLELPDGLRTRLNLSGAPLSRSTALLLTLARAVVARPRAIVIDGVLDELDSESLARAIAVLTDSEAPWSLLVFTARDDVAAAVGEVVEIRPPRPEMAAVGSQAEGEL